MRCGFSEAALLCAAPCSADSCCAESCCAESCRAVPQSELAGVELGWLTSKDAIAYKVLRIMQVCASGTAVIGCVRMALLRRMQAPYI